MKSSAKKSTIIIAIIIFILGGAYVLLQNQIFKKELPEGLIQANGRMEGDDYSIASKIPGKIKELKVREGDSVEKGQLAVLLDDDRLRAKANQAKANHQAAKAKLEASKQALVLLKKEVPILIQQAEAGVKAAEASVSKAWSAEKQSKKDALRFQKLAKQGSIGRQKSEQADLAWEISKKDLEKAESFKIQAKKKLQNARLGKTRITAKTAEVKAVNYQVSQALAVVEEIDSLLEDMRIKSPAKGEITTRIANLGEVIPAGAPIFSMVDLDKLYLKVFVPEVQIGKVRKGLKAKIYTDAFPERPFTGTIKYIASKAEFTPKEVQTPDERVKLVYAVKIYLDENPDHSLTPGLPADAVIRWKEDVPWMKPRW